MSLEFVAASSERVERAHNAALNVGSADFCVTCWFNISASGDYIASKGRFASIGPGWGLRRDPGGVNALLAVFSDGTGGFDIVQTAGAISTGVWHHAAIVRDNGAGLYRLYLDGVEVGTTVISNASGSLDSPEKLLIGAVNEPAGTPTRFMDGFVDDFRQYNRLAIPAEISTIHAVQGKDGIVNGLAVRYIMNEKAPGVAASGVGSVKDFGPNVLDADPVNTPTYRSTILSFRKRGP